MFSPSRVLVERSGAEIEDNLARSSSTPIAKAVAEEVVQVGDVADLADRRLDIIFDTAETDEFALEEDVAGARVAVARLADGADVDDRLVAADPPLAIDLSPGAK